jgi:beta-xylosidase
LGDTFWAPEVAFANGRFHLYYSAGWGDKSHQLRVAVSELPLGPFEDVGVGLTDLQRTPFAIDPHPFCDNDGRWYLFYARDFLDHDSAKRAGTALAMARLEMMTKLSADESVVLRARHNWQRFMKDRPMYGSIYDWHTLEGPCLRKRAGRYYCFYSGGRWENETYGVDFAVSENVLGPYSDSGAENGPRVLRTIPGALHGPGHNSIITGPDGQEYIVHHAWDPGMTGRRMFISRLIWTDAGPRCEQFQ